MSVLDTSRLPNERFRRAIDNYERIHRENKDLKRGLEECQEGIRSLSALVTDGASAAVKKNVTQRLRELNLLPIVEPEEPEGEGFEETEDVPEGGDGSDPEAESETEADEVDDEKQEEANAQGNE